MGDIKSFSGRYSFLSNFYPVKILLDGVEYPTLEHAFQASKTADELTRRVILEMKTPALARAVGKSKVVMRDMRSDWDKVRVDVTLNLLRRKFSDRGLKEKLLETGDSWLEEGNTWGDRFWGTVNGEGENALGILLMVVRYELQEREDKINNLVECNPYHPDLGEEPF